MFTSIKGRAVKSKLVALYKRMANIADDCISEPRCEDEAPTAEDMAFLDVRTKTRVRLTIKAMLAYIIYYQEGQTVW